MGTKCAPILSNLVLYSNEADFMQSLIRKNGEELARLFSFMFRYIDDVLSLNTSSSKFGDYFGRIYHIAFKNRKIPQIQQRLLHMLTYM